MNAVDRLTTGLISALDFLDCNSEMLGIVERPGIDFTRNAKLSRKDVMMALVSMSGGALAKELEECGLSVLVSTFVEARKKIPAQAFELLFEWFNRNTSEMDRLRAYGRRILAADGTVVNMARNPAASSFMQNSGHPEGLNQLHLNAIYDISNNTYFDARIQPQPQTNEVQALVDMIEAQQFDESTLLLADRGYQSYNLIEHISRKRNLDFLIRVKDSRTSWKAIQQLPMRELDVDVTTTISTTQRKADKQAGHVFLQTHTDSEKEYSSRTRAGRWDFESPCEISFRVVRLPLSTGEYETVVTSLPKVVPSDTVKELYHSRWGIETSFNQLKHAMGLIFLHGKSDEFVMQEIYAQLTAFNFCSRVCAAVPVEQKEGNIYQYKINFTQAVHRCREFLKGANMSSEELMEKISRNVVPDRPGRADKRKLHPKGFVGFTYRVAA